MSWRFSLAFLDPQLALFCFPFCEISNESASRVVRRFVVLHCSGRCSCSLDASAIEILLNFDEFRVSTFDTFWVSFIFICSKFYQSAIDLIRLSDSILTFFSTPGLLIEFRADFSKPYDAPSLLLSADMRRWCAPWSNLDTSARAKWR